MATTFNEKIERFININSFYVSRVQTSNVWFALQGVITFDVDALDRLVLPEGMHIEEDYYSEFSERKCYFLVDDKSGEYEELIDRRELWTKYTDDLKMMRALDEVYAN